MKKIEEWVARVQAIAADHSHHDRAVCFRHLIEEIREDARNSVVPNSKSPSALHVRVGVAYNAIGTYFAKGSSTDRLQHETHLVEAIVRNDKRSSEVRVVFVDLFVDPILSVDELF